MRPLVLLVLSVAVLGASSALAGKGSRGDDRARLEDARARGAVMPIERLLALLAGEIGGEIVEIELDEDDGRLVYEIYYLDAGGRRHEITVDAASGAVLERDEDD